VPEREESWAVANSEAVFKRRQEGKLSLEQLSEEFGRSKPTLSAAIKTYLKDHPEEVDAVKLPVGGKRPKKFDLAAIGEKARTLWIAGWSKERLAAKFGCSAPTVHKAIAFVYARDGLTMPTRQETRSSRTTSARDLHNQGLSLDDIAATLNVSDVTARQLLRESYAAQGKPMPDLRRRSTSDDS
jgi:biotin operon repressor